MPGFCDFIGYVEPRLEADEFGEDHVVYPPFVSFEPNGQYMAKWTGLMPPGGATRKMLNVEMILKAARGELKRKEVNENVKEETEA